MNAKRKSRAASSMTQFREETVSALARIEGQNLSIIERQTENRETVIRQTAEMRAALDKHTDQDTENFNILHGRQTRMDRTLHVGIGGVAVLQVVIGIIVALVAAGVIHLG